MSGEIRGYGARPVIEAKKSKYLPVSNKLKLGLFPKAEIKNHMEKYNVDLTDCDPDDASKYESFEDYLARPFKEGVRPLDGASNSLICPCDGWLTAHFVNNLCTIPVNGHMYSVDKLMGGEGDAKDFAEGLALIIRLDEADPHRFINIDDGVVVDVRQLEAEKNQEDSMFFGPRTCTVMNTKHFHGVVQVEACGNAKGVEQLSDSESPAFSRGEVKGRFLCSTAGIILLFKKGMMLPDDEFMVNTRKGLETRVRMGEKLGMAITMMAF